MHFWGSVWQGKSHHLINFASIQSNRSRSEPVTGNYKSLLPLLPSFGFLLLAWQTVLPLPVAIRWLTDWLLCLIILALAPAPAPALPAYASVEYNSICSVATPTKNALFTVSLFSLSLSLLWLFDFLLLAVCCWSF